MKPACTSTHIYALGAIWLTIALLTLTLMTLIQQGGCGA